MASELVFREVPAKSVQRRGCTDWLGGLVLVPLDDPLGRRVARVAGAPTGLCLLTAGFLAVRLTARALTVADSVIRPEPAPTDPARFLPGIGHARPSSLAWVGQFWWVQVVVSRERRSRSPLAAGIEMFLAHKQALGLHLRTTESVIRLLDRFLVEQHVETIEAITPDVIEAFLVSRPRIVPHSFNQLLGIVTRLFEWLIARGLVSRSPVQAKPRRTTASRLPFLFDPATARRLIDAAGALHDTRNTPRRGLTYRTIFALLYALGLRVGEVARLRMSDIDLTRQLLVVRETKFAKSRFVPFGPRVGELVADYLSHRSMTEDRMIADQSVFSFRKSQPLSPCTISTVFHELVSQLALSVPDGTRPPCVHSLRHYVEFRTMPSNLVGPLIFASFRGQTSA